MKKKKQKRKLTVLHGFLLLCVALIILSVVSLVAGREQKPIYRESFELMCVKSGTYKRYKSQGDSIKSIQEEVDSIVQSSATSLCNYGGEVIYELYP